MGARYFVGAPGAKAARVPKDAVLFEDGKTLLSGAANFETSFGAPTSLELDLLRIAAAAFAADRGTERGMREDIGRDINVSVPIVNAAVLAPMRKHFEGMLRFLSRDAWTLQFRQMGGEPEPETEWPEDAGTTLLFSGGLDSLAAAVEFSTGKNVPLQLVSHTTHNSVSSTTQTRLASALSSAGLPVTHRQFFVSSRSGEGFDHAIENSQRTRSFVFLVLGALAARRTGQRRVLFLAENGQMAIHLALTPARFGAFSTLTAHPTFLTRMQQILEGTLSCKFVLENPYVHRTKREVIAVLHQRHPELIAIANSCWRNVWVTAGTHCGACVPCLVRRIALEKDASDPTHYARDIWREDIRNLDAADDGRRNMIDLLEFAVRIKALPPDEIKHEWPELYSADLNGAKVIAMYKRFAIEALGVASRYPFVSVLL